MLQVRIVVGKCVATVALLVLASLACLPTALSYSLFSHGGAMANTRLQLANGPTVTSTGTGHGTTAAPTGHGGNGASSPILISPVFGSHPNAVQIFDQLAGSMHGTSLQWIRSASELLAPSIADTNKLKIVDQSVVDALQTEDLEALTKQNNLIRVIFEDFIDASTSALSQSESACLHDFYVPSLTNRAHNDFYASLSHNEYVHKLRVRWEALMEYLSAPRATLAQTELDAGHWSQFLSLTFDSIDAALPHLSALRIGIDAFELRVDLLQDQSASSIARQIALLRDACPQLPIVYTVRSKGQIGRFPDNPSLMFPLLKQGLRNAVEWLDIEACWPDSFVSPLCTSATTAYRGHTRLLGSLHVTDTGVPQSEVEALFHRAALNGSADMLKVVIGAASGGNDCQTVHLAGQAASQSQADNNKAYPYIGVCLGAHGADSRVSNLRFTPCTHPLMAAAAPGQLTAAQLVSLRLERGLIGRKQYWLFGSPIAHSLSPAMHNAAYKALGLSDVFQYGLDEQMEVSGYVGRLRDDAVFGGASVTIPHKESVMPLLDEVRGAARDIGAVNTIVEEGSDKSRRLVGYNTDWLGIRRPIERLLRRRSTSNTAAQGVGLVIGAGGTAKAACYAVRDLGLDLVVCNRSPEKAADLARKFGGKALSMDELSSLLSGSGGKNEELLGFSPDLLRVIVSTVPLQAQQQLPFLPPALLAGKPIVFDVVYRPARTPLLDQALAAGCPVVQGASMLLEQGIEQFQLWQRRKAPRAEMQEAVFAGIERLST